MKRADQILKLLVDSGDAKTAKQIADACNTVPQNIGSVFAELCAAGLLTKAKNAAGDQVYEATDAGRIRVAEPGFGTEGRAAPRAAGVPAMQPLNMGVFTNGELHIEANGKKLVLTKAQTNELVEFICSLPNKLFSDRQERPTLASLPSRVIRSE
ncbi:hypothetical protein [Herbaspirillum sp. ST 5-3]|uniref:hypothetical protein n=1 Tax=Oxalobacteraceae TaxID=75682 RepID=UPI0010A4D04C|nr:hypothetical protein [Herbaspirillum sp. ST 5-3]